MDVHRAASRLVVAGTETAAFTLRTNSPKPLVGEATAIRVKVSRSARPAEVGSIAELAGIKAARALNESGDRLPDEVDRAVFTD